MDSFRSGDSKHICPEEKFLQSKLRPIPCLVPGKFGIRIIRILIGFPKSFSGAFYELPYSLGFISISIYTCIQR